MDQIGHLALAWRLQHRHGDRWVALEERRDELGDERAGRANGRLFVCPDCAEEVRVLDADPSQGAAEA